jgi:hypothetical protein
MVQALETLESQLEAVHLPNNSRSTLNQNAGSVMLSLEECMFHALQSIQRSMKRKEALNNVHLFAFNVTTVHPWQSLIPQLWISPFLLMDHLKM